MKTAHRFHQYGRYWDLTVADEVMAKDYQAGHFHEGGMLDWMKDHIPHGGIWVDAGANIGNHTLPFAQWSDLVVAIEPIHENMQTLRENVFRNHLDKKVLCVEIGVGKGPEFLRVQKGGVGRPSQFELRAGPPEVAVVAIDSILPSAMPVRVLKVDVEGMEVDALAGAIKTIDKHRPEVFVEIWDEVVLDQIGRMLATFGYGLIERWNHAPTYHFSANKNYPVTYTPPVK